MAAVAASLASRRQDDTAFAVSERHHCISLCLDTPVLDPAPSDTARRDFRIVDLPRLGNVGPD